MTSLQLQTQPSIGPQLTAVTPKSMLFCEHKWPVESSLKFGTPVCQMDVSTESKCVWKYSPFSLHCTIYYSDMWRICTTWLTSGVEAKTSRPKPVQPKHKRWTLNIKWKIRRKNIFTHSPPQQVFHKFQQFAGQPLIIESTWLGCYMPGSRW